MPDALEEKDKQMALGYLYTAPKKGSIIMPALQSQPETVTLEQYEALPESDRAEVFDGRIYYMASPSQEHQTILLELSSLINSYVKKKKGECKVFIAPFDVKLSDIPLVIVQPDIMIVW